MRTTLPPTLPPTLALLLTALVVACSPAADPGSAASQVDGPAARVSPGSAPEPSDDGERSTDSTEVGASDVAAAEAALRPFQQALMGTLTTALPEGPVAAVDACHIEAPQIPGEAAGAGVVLGRLSDRLRNPDNRTPDWAAPLWARMQAAPDAAAPQTVALEGGRIGHLAPIRTAPMCLTCHGSDLAPAVAAAIDERYPQDGARGYAAGDLRGAFWLTMPRS